MFGMHSAFRYNQWTTPWFHQITVHSIFTGYSLEVIPQYAKYLKALYSNYPITKSDKFPPTISERFIKLALVKKQKGSLAQDRFTHLTIDDIFKADDKVRLVVVEGEPGIGKSTLAWELCRQWPTLESLKRFSLVVFLRLREEGVQSATDISDLFYHHNTELSRHLGKEVEKREGDGVLFVFDGFDEFPSNRRHNSLVMDIISGSKYLPSATVLVTSRPSTSAELQTLLETAIDKHIEVVGFSEKEIFKFAHSVLGDTNLLADFNAYITANPVLKGMMYNPLNCAIVVGVYQDTYESGKPVPHTQTQLYTELTLCLLSRYLNAMGDPLAMELPDNLEDLPHDSDLYQQLVKVGELAFEGKLKEQVIFKQLPKGCSDLGLLVERTALHTRKKTTTYNFFHLTLQEYMSAFYISQLPADEQRTLFSKHSTMKVVWRFVAGLTKMQNIGWYELKKNEYNMYSDVMVVGDFLPTCFYEAQDVQSCESVFDHHRVTLFNYMLSNYALYALGYCISLCSNTWTIAIDTEGLEMLGHGMKSVDYGGGSIDKLRLGFDGNVNEEHLLQIPHQILHHIKTLHLKNKYIYQLQGGFDSLAECIPYLHSLTSLSITSIPGHGSVKLLFALKKHGKLQRLQMNIAIDMDIVAALAGLVQPSSSLRELVVGEIWEFTGSQVKKQLVKTVLSPSSLNTVTILGHCPLRLDDIETISDSINSLTFCCGEDHMFISKEDEDHPFIFKEDDISVSWHLKGILPYLSKVISSLNPLWVSGGTKLSHILRENTSLKEVKLHIPLDKDEVQDIIDSLKDNHSLKRLELSIKYHSQYFSESEKQALDPRVIYIMCPINTHMLRMYMYSTLDDLDFL